MERVTTTRLLLLLAAVTVAGAQDYDLLLKGGHVIDPRNDVNRVADVAISNGAVAAVGDNLPASSAKQVVDARGLYVTPGLVDLHVHVNAGTGEPGSYSGDNSVYPDAHTLRAGVTTAVDAGSSGAANFEDFKDRVIDRSKTRILAFLNIVNKGMRGGAIEQDLKDMQPGPTAAMAKKHPDIVVGVKTAHFAGPEWDPVDRAVEAAEMFGGVVMVDFGQFHPARPFGELITEHLRDGDIYTHTYLGRVPMFDEKGRLEPYFFEARMRGVKFDVGHGAGSFWWDKAVPAIRQGFWPDSISTDLHVNSMMEGMKDMTNVMSKILNQGVPLYDVIDMSTSAPALQIQREELGHLRVGAPADVAVLRLDHGRFGFIDSEDARFEGTKKLTCELTVREGKVVWDLNGLAAPDWQLHYGKL